MNDTQSHQLANIVQLVYNTRHLILLIFLLLITLAFYFEMSRIKEFKILPLFFSISMFLSNKILSTCSVLSLSLLLSLLATNLFAQTPQQPKADCRSSKVRGSSILLCLHPQADLMHDIYSLRVDNMLVFSVVDDFIENVVLSRKMYQGESIEFRLSNQGLDPVKITGGCKPILKNTITIARVCNFNWGNVNIIKNVRFSTSS